MYWDGVCVWAPRLYYETRSLVWQLCGCRVVEVRNWHYRLALLLDCLRAADGCWVHSTVAVNIGGLTGRPNDAILAPWPSPTGSGPGG